MFKKQQLTKTECSQSMQAIKDALQVLSGKWKLPIILALSDGPLRFKELQRAVNNITPKILSKELKELELNEFVERTVHATSPVTVEYNLTPYSGTLEKLIAELQSWGLQHRQYIFSKSKMRKAVEA
ncbi:winged helix-turn-helix transcriptional regulator [Foetidibacter luteolus]|uniref:winged helix-turn-helix transcriptional regulator n=1 Tax=Foetidibacter luteolus TaxID=2608880 RepID=UPI00129C0DAC|nr:helix-turn-helix domain-containing protein [Foetidibacter luteolus]